MKPLHLLLPGEKAFIVDIQNSKFCETLFEMGVFPGDLVEMKTNDAEQNSVVVNINNRIYNIYRPTAEIIITNVVSFEFWLN